MDAKQLRKINSGLYDLSRQKWESIPLDKIFALCAENGAQAIQEDGTPWSGWLCGEEGSCHIELAGVKNKRLQIQWYKYASGRYELNAYVA